MPTASLIVIAGFVVIAIIGAIMSGHCKHRQASRFHEDIQ